MLLYPMAGTGGVAIGTCGRAQLRYLAESYLLQLVRKTVSRMKARTQGLVDRRSQGRLCVRVRRRSVAK